MAAAKLAEANNRASSYADAQSQYLAELAELRRTSDDSLKRARNEATLRIEQDQAIAQQQITAIEAQAATEVQIAQAQAAAARKDASELAEVRVQAAIADADKRIEAITNSEQSLAVDVARMRSELAEALDTLEQRDANAAQAESTAQLRVADIEEEAVLWKQSAEESFAATLAAYRDKMESKVVEVEHQLLLAREEAQQNAEVTRRKVQGLEHAERRAVRKVGYIKPLQCDFAD